MKNFITLLSYSMLILSLIFSLLLSLISFIAVIKDATEVSAIFLVAFGTYSYYSWGWIKRFNGVSPTLTPTFSEVADKFYNQNTPTKVIEVLPLKKAMRILGALTILLTVLWGLGSWPFDTHSLRYSPFSDLADWIDFFRGHEEARVIALASLLGGLGWYLRLHIGHVIFVTLYCIFVTFYWLLRLLWRAL